MINAIRRMMAGTAKIDLAIEKADLNAFHEHLKSFENIGKKSAFESIALTILKHLNVTDENVNTRLEMLKLIGQSAIKPDRVNWSKIVEQIAYEDRIGAKSSRRLNLVSMPTFNLDNKTLLVIDTMIQHAGFDINAADEDGATLLMYAAYRPGMTPEKIQELISRGADVNRRSKEYGRAIHFVSKENINAFRVFATLVSAGANPNEHIKYRPMFYRDDIESSGAVFNSYEQYLGYKRNDDYFDVEAIVKNNIENMSSIMKKSKANLQAMQTLENKADDVDGYALAATRRGSQSL